MITIFDSSDLSYAVQYSRILKLQIFLDSSKDQNICQSQQLDTIQRELRFIRDRVNQLLDTLSVSAPSKPSNRNNSSNGQIKSSTNSEQSKSLSYFKLSACILCLIPLITECLYKSRGQ